MLEGMKARVLVCQQRSLTIISPAREGDPGESFSKWYEWYYQSLKILFETKNNKRKKAAPNNCG